MPSQNRFQYSRGALDPNPFCGQPSGSEWGRPHVEWLNIRFEWECEWEKLFTKKSKFEESATIVQYLQRNLDMPWSQVAASGHETGSLYDRLFELARSVEPTPLYVHEPVLPSSSPPRSQESDVSISPHGKVVARPVSESSSPDSPKSRPALSSPKLILRQSARPFKQAPLTSKDLSSQDFEPLSEHSASDNDSTYPPDPSSSQAALSKNNDGSSPETKLEKDVEFAATAFLYLMVEAFKSTNVDISQDELREQDLTTQFAIPRGLEIEIDGLNMTSHPDLAASLSANGTKVDIVIEAKRLKTRLAEDKLLAQEVSELLGAALKYRRVFRRNPEKEKPEEYIVRAMIPPTSERPTDQSVYAYLISWHFLECYISRMKVTEEYLRTLGNNSRKLPACKPPVVRRSRTFGMKDPDQRTEFATMVARAGIELLYQFPAHRGNGTGLVRRFRGITPSKIT